MITIILYQKLDRNSTKADELTQFTLVDYLYQRNLLSKVICLHADVKSMRDKVIEVNKIPIFRIALVLTKIIAAILPNLSTRYYLEILFDHIAWRLIDKQSSLVYSSKPSMAYTFDQCHKIGIKTILRASIAHPLLNYTIVKNEEIKFGLKSSGSYTNLKRAIRISKSINLANRIFVNQVNPSHSFLPDSYTRFVKPNKVTTYENVFATTNNRKTNIQDNANVEKTQPLLFIHVAHMSIIKGTHYLLEAWRMFQNMEDSDSELVLIGTIDQNLKRILSSNQLLNAPNIKMVGPISDPFNKYRHAAASIVSSLSEMGPATIIESLSQGVPVISTMSCGLSGLINDNSNGFIYRYNDVEELCRIFRWFNASKDKIPHLRYNASKIANKYSIESYKDEMLELINSVYEGNN